MDTFVSELKGLLQQQRNCFDAYRGDPPNPRGGEGDLEQFVVLTHVSLCQLISKIIDHQEGKLEVSGECHSGHVLQFVPTDDSA